MKYRRFFVIAAGFLFSITSVSAQQKNAPSSTMAAAMKTVEGLVRDTSGLAIAATTAPILRIVVIDAKGDPASYVREVKRGKPILKRLGIEGEIHVWQATYAGKDTGMIIVTFEFPDKASFARSEAAFEKAPVDPEYGSWVKSLGKVRTITSDSLFEELDSHVDSHQ